jgi:hypothetical protein
VWEGDSRPQRTLGSRSDACRLNRQIYALDLDTRIQATCIIGWKTRDLSNIIFLIDFPNRHNNNPLY